MPPLSGDQRKKYASKAKDLGEEGRVSLRNIRRDANDHLKKLLKDHELGEDDERHALAEVQKLTDEHIEEINSGLKKKEEEINKDGRLLVLPMDMDEELRTLNLAINDQTIDVRRSLHTQTASVSSHRRLSSLKR